MFDRIEILGMAVAMARHAGTRQAVVAQNIANADTPGYKARDVVPFADLVSDKNGGFISRATRSGHLHGSSGPLDAKIIASNHAMTNPNGNGVTLEDEMLNGVEAKRQHDRALAIYRSGLTILRTSLGRGA